MGKSLRNHFFVISLGIILYTFIPDKGELFYFLSFVGGIIIYFYFFWFIFNSKDIVDHFFPIPKNKFLKMERKFSKKEKKLGEKKKDRRRKKLNRLFYLFLLSGFIFLIVEGKWIENLVEGRIFTIICAGLAFFIGVMFILYLKLKHSYYFIESDTRFKIILLPLLFFIFFLAVGSNINHQFSQPEILKKEFKIIEKTRRIHKGGKSHHIFISTETRLKRFSIKEDIWENLYEGKTVVFHTQIGFFNFEFVKEIKLK